MDLTVAVATFGDESWVKLARTRAVPSAQALRPGLPVIHVHGATLHETRNEALAQVRTEWVVFLDADDELELGYIEAMASGSADVRAPAVRYIRGYGDRAAAPRMPRVAGHVHDCTGDCLPYGNWLVIGAAVRTELVRGVGGWQDYDWAEDWSVWLRCYLAGATFEAIPQAIYRAHVRRNSRNRGRNQEARLAAHRAIARDAGLEDALIP